MLLWSDFSVQENLTWQKTFEMFTNFVKWRKEGDIDNIKNVSFPEIDQIKVYYPHGFHKTDKLGRPIYIEVLGSLNIDELFKITPPEKLLQYQVQQYERLMREIFPACSQAAKKYIFSNFYYYRSKKIIY